MHNQVSLMVTGNPFTYLKQKPKSRIPADIESRAAEMLIKHESLHQVNRSTGLSKPYITKMRDKLKAEGKINAD